MSENFYVGLWFALSFTAILFMGIYEIADARLRAKGVRDGQKADISGITIYGLLLFVAALPILLPVFIGMAAWSWVLVAKIKTKKTETPR